MKKAPPAIDYADNITGPSNRTNPTLPRPWPDFSSGPKANAMVDCGWGRLLFGQTFAKPEDLCAALGAEAPNRRDIAFYVRDPHVVLAAAPQELFLDPSHTYRLDLSTYKQVTEQKTGVLIRRMTSFFDAEQVNRIYIARGMVPVPSDFFWSNRDSRSITVFVAEDQQNGQLVGTIMGVDHARAFGDPEHGSSLWCLGVDPQARHPRIGELLVRRLAEHCIQLDAAYLDLSVLHDNTQAIGLYERLGFRRIQSFAIKRRNTINERLYVGPSPAESLNPYATIIVNEALRRGVHVEVTDAEGGLFRLDFGGRTITCRESLSSLTTGVAVSICDDKSVTRRFVEKAGIEVPDQLVLSGGDDLNAAEVKDRLQAFLTANSKVVVKPTRGEQGRGISVDLSEIDEVIAAITMARSFCDRVIIEEMVDGTDLRVVVIDYKIAAAALRRPPTVVGNGQHDIKTLIEKQSRRRAAATQGESTIPLDAETERCVARAGYEMHTVLDDGIELIVRKTANLHTGGTIHDVTDSLNAEIANAAIAAARAIEIPVVGIDFMVGDPASSEYAFIEANERPGLANHEPQKPAERFLDLLFPLSVPASKRATTAKPAPRKKKKEVK